MKFTMEEWRKKARQKMLRKRSLKNTPLLPAQFRLEFRHWKRSDITCRDM